MTIAAAYPHLAGAGSKIQSALFVDLGLGIRRGPTRFSRNVEPSRWMCTPLIQIRKAHNRVPCEIRFIELCSFACVELIVDEAKHFFLISSGLRELKLFDYSS